MDRTTFAGLTRLEPLEPLSTDDYSFQSVNPAITDRLLEVGAVTHRHDAHERLENPEHAPSAVALPTGGTIPSDTSIEFAYTTLDIDGGETAASPVGSVTTRSKIEPPEDPPTLVADYTAGSLPPGVYYYGVTFTDGGGGETTMGAIGSVNVDYGYVNARVLVSGLTTGMATASAAGWRLYKSTGGSDFSYCGSGTIDTFEDVAACVDGLQPPPSINTTQRFSSVDVTLPIAQFDPAVVGWKLYATVTSGSFATNSLVGSGSPSDDTVTLTNYSPTFGKPPARNLSIPGASRINLETDISNWHWRTPVANYTDLIGGSLGDVKLVTGTGELYAVLTASTGAASGWTNIAPSGTIRHVSASGGTRVSQPSEIIFEGASGAVVQVTRVGGSAKVTIISGAGGGTATGGDIHIGGSAGIPTIIDNEYVEFRASGSASVAIQDMGGGSAAVLIGTRPYPRQGIDIGGSAGVPTIYRRDYIEFVGSAGGIVGIEDMGLGSARVVISASGSQGPTGPAGSQGAQGAAGDGTITRVSGSAISAAIVTPVRHLEFGASGAASVAVQDLGGASARVVIGATGGGGGSAVAVLPGSPTDGQEISLLVDGINGIIWKFRYRAGSPSAFKWEFIGGPPISHEILTSESRTNVAYGDLATVGPTLTLPLAGDYILFFAATQSAAVVNAATVTSPKIGAAVALDNDALQLTSSTANAGATQSKSIRRDGLAAADVIKLQYRVTSGQGDWFRRVLQITPVRVG